MRYIRGGFIEPTFNLAMEDYFFHGEEECFMLWQNKPSVIIGRNQNAMAEIDYAYTREQNIAVARRITGGGAVYHDAGNLNFTYIVNNRDFGDYQGFTENLCRFLNENGCPAVLSGRNDLMADGMKFSGNAQHIVKNRILHHGTLLFDSDLSVLSDVLRPDPEKIKSHGIASVRKRVCNLKEFLPQWETQDFWDALEHYMIHAEGLHVKPLTEEEITAIEALRAEKFSTYDWIWGESPAYDYHKKARFTGGTAEVFLDVKKGIIEDVCIFGDFFSQREVADLEQALIGTRHEKQAVTTVLTDTGFDRAILGITLDDLLSLFF